MAIRKATILVDGVETEVEIDFPEAVAAPAARVRKTVLIARIVAVPGLAARVMTGLNANAALRLVFDAAADFAVDDAQLRGLLSGAGADLAVLLAP